MKKAAKGLAASLFTSKKFVALLVGLLVTLATYPMVRWAGMGEEEAAKIALPIITKVVILVTGYLGGQGLADFGKEAKKTAEPLQSITKEAA